MEIAATIAPLCSARSRMKATIRSAMVEYSGLSKVKMGSRFL